MSPEAMAPLGLYINQSLALLSWKFTWSPHWAWAKPNFNMINKKENDEFDKCFNLHLSQMSSRLKKNSQNTNASSN